MSKTIKITKKTQAVLKDRAIFCFSEPEEQPDGLIEGIIDEETYSRIAYHTNPADPWSVQSYIDSVAENFHYVH